MFVAVDMPPPPPTFTESNEEQKGVSLCVAEHGDEKLAGAGQHPDMSSV